MKMQQMAKRYDHSSYSDDEEEALSLCDLPIDLVANKDHRLSRNEEANQEEDFNFSSLDISHSAEEQMCVADEVFFKGQILPLRLSVSSDTGSSARFPLPPSRSESMDYRRSPSVGFTSNSSSSSRSSSTKSSSHNSLSSGNDCTPAKRARSKPIIRNQFHAHPSPSPQLKIPSTRHRHAGSRSRKSSSAWDLFRVGLVRTPEIELHDLKARSNSTSNNKPMNKSFGSKNSSSESSTSNEGNANHGLIRRRFFDKDGKGLFSGCKCSADVIETAPSKIVIMKKSDSAAIYHNPCENETGALKEKLLIMKLQKQGLQLKHHRPKQDGRETVSHHRTSEWLKELSI